MARRHKRFEPRGLFSALRDLVRARTEAVPSAPPRAGRKRNDKPLVDYNTITVRPACEQPGWQASAASRRRSSHSPHAVMIDPEHAERVHQKGAVPQFCQEKGISLMLTELAGLIVDGPNRIAMPIAVYAALKMVGGTVRDAVTESEAQVAAALALRDRFDTRIMFTAMDLSVEAEAFGCEVRMPENEVPSVVGRRATTWSEIDALPAPCPGEGRTRIFLETAERLLAESRGTPVVGELIGPFSLAARIAGVTETLMATLAEPKLVLRLLERVTPFLIDYALAFRLRGAAGVLVAEPAAGLLSPSGLAQFSNPFVRRIVDAVQCRTFAVILHNCAAKLIHLDRMLETGAELLHVGQPMDLPAALERVKGRAVLCGNLDPASVFLDGTPETVFGTTARLLAATAGQRAFALSTGCDLPPGTPIENLAAFCRAARQAPPDARPASDTPPLN